jgi:hypothetical protein
VTADFIAARFPQARTVADVAGGQGMLARRLRKRHNIECDVVDPRGWVLRGVPSHAAYGASERVVLGFRGPHNRALVLRPASRT